MSDDLNAIKAQIQSHLVNLGNYDLIFKSLMLQLSESGWLDQVSKLASQEIEAQPTDKPLNFDELYLALQPKAEKMVPDEVRSDVLEKIKHYLDSTIQ